MARINRFEDYRFVGTRDDMVVYDTDDRDEAAALDERVSGEDLFDRNLLQTFGPDEV